MATAFISIDKPFYFAGDTVQGQVFLNLYENIVANQVLIKFKGWESVKWFEERIVPEHQRPNIAANQIFNMMIKIRMDSSDSEDHPGEDQSLKYRYVQDGAFLKEIIKHTGQKQIARFDNVLYNFEGSYIPAGQYAFPFSFKTGQNYPASFLDKSVQNNRRGRIKYEMQAFVRGFNSRLRIIKCKQQIIIRETTPIKNDHQIMQAHVTSCCCIDQGTTRIQCFFQKNAYSPGQDARMYCKCDNTEGKSQVVSVDVSLVNQITYTSSDAHKKTFSQVLFKKSFQGLGIGQKGERQQSVKILNSQIGTNAADIKPTARGTRLHSVYFLQVEANLSAACTCCSDLPIVKQPILIFPLIPIDYNFKAPPNWAPIVMPMKNFQVSLGGLVGIGMNVPSVQMNISAPPPPQSNFNASINVNPPPPPAVNMNVNMNMKGPQMSSNINQNNYQSPQYGQTHMNMNMGPGYGNQNVGMNIEMNTGMNNGMNNGMSIQMNTGMNVGMNARMF